MAKKNTNRAIGGWLAALLGVIGVAILMRFYDIQNFPGGIYPGGVPVAGRAFSLFTWLTELSLTMFGIGVWQVHVVSGVIGVLTVVAIYFATKIFFGRLAGVLAAFFLATSYWHVTLSRGSFWEILTPLFLAGFLAAVGYLVQAVKDDKKDLSYVYAVLAGAMFAGGFYASLVFSVLFFVVLGVVVLLLLAAIHPKVGFPHMHRYGWQGLMAIAIVLLLLFPVGWRLVQQPSDLFNQVASVSVFNAELQDAFGGGTLAGTLYYSTRETLLSFFYGVGDMNWRHSVVGRPLLDPVVGIFFLLGLAWVIRGAVDVFVNIVRGKEVHMGMVYSFLLLLLLGWLVPVIVTAQGIPHALRSAPLIVPIFVLVGTAAAVVLHWMQARMKGNVRAAAVGALYGAIIVSGLYSGAQYMVIARNDSGAAYAYRSDLPVAVDYLVQYVGEHEGIANPLLVIDSFSVQSVDFLIGRQDRELYRRIDVDVSESVSPEPGVIIIFTQSTLDAADQYEVLYKDDIELIESRDDRFGQEIMRVYMGVGDVIPSDEPPSVEFDLDA